ncbi:MAG: demethoxyubiquinone hydroxylase family protein [Rhodospirillales bacterium]|nr:demethoxyubiquinone hydroxylase family protein [Rhodospirillales bacterium]
MTERRRTRRKQAPRLPGDPTPEQRVSRILRVDHAGEYGAKRIYEGQLAVLGETSAGPVIREMAEGEERHLASFAEDLADREVRPTVLLPLWHVAGYALGAATALLGREGAMACTEAVEEVIDGHYARQERALGESEPELREKIREFRADELGHRDTARAEGAAAAPGYRVLRRSVRASTRLAIWLSERV